MRSPEDMQLLLDSLKEQYEATPSKDLYAVIEKVERMMPGARSADEASAEELAESAEVY